MEGRDKNYIKNPDLCFICLGLKAAEVSFLPSCIILDAKEITNHIAKQILVCNRKLEYYISQFLCNSNVFTVSERIWDEHCLCFNENRFH